MKLMELRGRKNDNIELFYVYNMIAGISVSFSSQELGTTGKRNVVGRLYFRLS